MEEIYANVEYDKPADPTPSSTQTGPRSSERFHGAVVLCLGLLSVFLLAGLIGLSVTYRDSLHDLAVELSAVKGSLTERLQASDDKLSSVSQERDLLKTSLTEKTRELERLQSLFNQKKSCPAGWTMFSCACYLLSTTSDSWEKARKDCEDRGAHLVIINSYEEQEFLTKMIKNHTWIGLSDRDHEGTWKWIDGTPLTQAYWWEGQPDGGAGIPQYGDEDCADILSGANPNGNWNDLRCDKSLQWICEKVA